MEWLAVQSPWFSFGLTTAATWFAGRKAWFAPWLGVVSCLFGVLTGLNLGQPAITLMALTGLALSLRQGWLWLPRNA